MPIEVLWFPWDGASMARVSTGGSMMIEWSMEVDRAVVWLKNRFCNCNCWWRRNCEGPELQLSYDHCTEVQTNGPFRSCFNGVECILLIINDHSSRSYTRHMERRCGLGVACCDQHWHSSHGLGKSSYTAFQKNSGWSLKISSAWEFSYLVDSADTIRLLPELDAWEPTCVPWKGLMQSTQWCGLPTVRGLGCFWRALFHTWIIPLQC